MKVRRSNSAARPPTRIRTKSVSRRLSVIWRYFRRKVLPFLIFYAMPFYGLSKLSLRLTGGALWFPPEWRSSVEVLVLAIGACSYLLVRGRVLRSGRSSLPDGRWARFLGPDRYTLMAAVALLVTLGLLAAQFGMRHRFLNVLSLPLGQAARIVLEDSRDPSEIRWDDELAARFAAQERTEGQYLEVRPHGVTLRLIVPPRTWMPPAFGAMLDEWAWRYPEAPWTHGLSEEPARVMGILESEPQAKRATLMVISIFLTLHVSILVTASAAYGWLYARLTNWREDAADGLGVEAAGAAG